MLYQSTYSAVANSRPVRCFHGPRGLISSVLYKPIVDRAFVPIRAQGGTDLAAAAGTVQAEFTHQALNRAACHLVALALQLPPNLSGAIDPIVGLEGAGDLGLEPRVTDRPGRVRT